MIINKIQNGYLLDLEGVYISCVSKFKEFMVKSCFGTTVNSPISFFNTTSKNGYFVDVFSIIGKHGIATSADFFVDISLTDELKLTANANTKGIGMKFPIPKDYKVNMSGYMEDVNLLYTTTYHFGDTHNFIPMVSKELRYPYVRIHKDNNEIFILFDKSDALFHVFYDNGFWVCYSTEKSKINVTVVINPDKKWVLNKYTENKCDNTVGDITKIDFAGSSVNRGTYKCDSKDNLVMWKDMQKLFYYGMDIVKDVPTSRYLSKYYSIAREIQSILMDNGIDSVILGSTAVNLHGIVMNIKDIDIAVRCKNDIQKAFEVLDNDYFPKMINDSQFSFVRHGILVSCFYYPMCSYDYVGSSIIVDDIRIGTKESLSECRLWIEWFMNNLNNEYNVIQHKNNNRLFYLIAHDDWKCFAAACDISSDGSDEDAGNTYMLKKYIKQLPTYFGILDKMKDRTLSNIKASVPYPCKCNVFNGKEKLLIPVINLGGERNISVKIKDKIKKVRAFSIKHPNGLYLKIKQEYNSATVNIMIDDIVLLEAIRK